MSTDGGGNHVGARIHAIVLTQDRPETLRRCITTTLSSLEPQDRLTILDDSQPDVFSTNAALLAATPPRVLAPTRIHLSMLRAAEVIARSVSTPCLRWLAKTSRRDIAPLRNLSLLLSVGVPAETTVLIDDDIHSFDLISTHHRLGALTQASEGVILGADIYGINEQDTITRLADAIEMLATLPHGAKTKSSRDLFQMSCDSASSIGSVRYVSAGYLAFRLPPKRLFAFPPGYNEDWLWCLLQGGHPKVQILRSGERVVHDPPMVRRATREDFLFELVGELVFDCLDEQHGRNNRDPEATLTALSECVPRADSMPLARARELMEKAQCLSEKADRLSALEPYGLAVLTDMLLGRELDMDGSRVLSDWCCDAIAKQRSVAATLRDECAMPALQSLMREGRL